MRMNYSKFLYVVAFATVFFSACGNDSSTSANNSNDGDKSSSSLVVIPGSTRNLTDSRDGQTYKTVNNQLLARFSSPRPVGIIVATARKRSRHCLLAAGTAVGITTARATARTSGVLQRAVATSRTSCTWSTTTTVRA